MSERTMLIAMLELAARDADERWFNDARDADDPFSFAWICAALELSPRRIAPDLPRIAADLRAARKDPRKNGVPRPVGDGGTGRRSD